MNREFLNDLGLEKDVVDSIMKEYGKSVNAQTTKITSLVEKVTDLNSQIETLHNENAELKKVDVEGLNKQIEELKSTNTSMNDTHLKAINDLKFEHALTLAIERSQSIDAVGLKAHINKEKLQYNAESNTVEGFDEQIKIIKKENPYLFNSASGGANHGGIDDNNGDKDTDLSSALENYYK